MNITIKRLPEKILFFILFMFCSALTHATPQITINNPTSDVSSQNNLEFDVSVVDSLPTYGFVDWDDSLVGWWRAEDNANDESRHANHGTFVGDANIVDTGKYGKAFSFDGDGDSVDIGDKEAFDFHKTDSFTISVWVYKTDNSPSVIVHKGAHFRLFYYTAQGWFFRLGNPDEHTYVFSGESNPQNRWINLVVVYNASDQAFSMYVDGQYKTNNDGREFGDFSCVASLNIGGRFWENYDHNGLIDEVMIFNRALASDEIKALYEVTNGSFLNTFNDLDEFATYSYQFYAVNTNGEMSSTEKKEILVDVPNTSPRVILESPLDNTREDSPRQTFKCTVLNTNQNTQLQRITFHWDYPGSFVADETKRVTGDSVSVEFVKTNLVGKTFEWNCSAVDTHNNSGFAPENFTYIVGRDEYHVAPNGDDNNPGTILLPFRTIQKAADIAMPGDTIYIRGGVYRETVTPPTSGNEFAPITFKGYPTEEGVISGADPLTGAWTQHQGAIYKTTMDWDLGLGNNQIFVNGKAMMEARWPNTDDISRPNHFPIDNGSSYDYEKRTGVLYSTNVVQSAGFWDGAIVHAIWGARYHAITGEVTSSSPGTLKLDFHSQPYWDITYGIFYITCSYNALDKAGEWFYDDSNSTLYLWTPSSNSPSTHTVEAKRRNIAFNLNGRSYITIEGLHIFAANITTDEYCHNILIDNCVMKYITHYTLIDESSMGSGAKGIRNTGVILDGHDNILQNSYIAYTAGNGVSLIGNNNIVRNCTIRDVNYVVTDCAAVHTGNRKTENNKIIHNKLYNAGRSLIMHSKAHNLKILHNEIYGARYGGETWDLGATYCIATDGKGTEIAYNYFHNNLSMGIYFDNYNYNFIVHHNVIEESPVAYPFIGLFFNTPSSDNQAYHNTVLSQIRVRADTPASNVIIKNNITGSFRYSNSATGPPTPEQVELSNNIYLNETDPTSVFIDYDAKDYHLKSGSPAIDAGVDLGFTYDIDGNPIVGAPDIGAYEYNKLKGDVNSDGIVNVQDVQCCVNHISGTQDWGSAADVNGDGKVDDEDIKEIIDTILKR